jgi:hypothetical protein
MEQESAPRREAVTCFGCRHFRVRHDPQWPYACEHFALRSRTLPALEVRRASGEDCRAREERPVAR